MPKRPTADSLTSLIKNNLDIATDDQEATDAIMAMLTPAAVRVAARAWILGGVRALRRERARDVEVAAVASRRAADQRRREEEAARARDLARQGTRCKGKYLGEDLSAGLVRERQKMERCRCEGGCAVRLDEFDHAAQEEFARREAEAVAWEKAEREWADSFDDTVVSWIEDPSAIPTEYLFPDVRFPHPVPNPLSRWFGESAGYGLSRRSDRVRNLMDEVLPPIGDVKTAKARIIVAGCTAQDLDPLECLHRNELDWEAFALSIETRIQKRADQMVLDLTTELLNSEFAVGDGVRVTWGAATLDQHRQRAEMTTKMAIGNADDAARHIAAVRMLTEAGLKTLAEVRVAA